MREAKEELNIIINLDDITDTFVVNRKNESLPSYYDVYFDNLPTDMIRFEKEAINNNLKGVKFSVSYIDNEEKL